MLIRPSLCLALFVLLAPQFAMAQKEPRTSSTPAAPSGQTVFMQRCSMCHGPIGEGVSAAITIAGPNIQAEHDAGRILAAEEIGPSHMPKFGRVLSVAEMRAVAY